MKIITFIVFLTFSIFTKAQDSTYNKNWDNGEKRLEHFFTTENKTGTWSQWNENGELIQSSFFKNDSLQWRTENEYYAHTKNLLYEVKEYNSQKTLIEQKTYQSNDSKSYIQASFYENGKLKSKGRITSTNKIGKWFYYEENGALKKTLKHKPLKGKTEGQKSKQTAKTKKNYKKGHYLTSGNKRIVGYFYRIGYNKLKFKASPEEKGEILNLGGILKITIETENLTIIESIELKLCSPFHQIRYNILVKNKLKGDLNLYSYQYVCNSGSAPMMGGNGTMYATPGVSINREVFMIRKIDTKEYIEVKKRKKPFRLLIKSLMKDKPEIMNELNFEEIKFKDLIPILEKYNAK